MATTSLQSAIDIANRRHASANRRAHLKRASDTQWLEHLEKSVQVLVDSLREDIRHGVRLSNNSSAALKETDALLRLGGKRT